MTAATFPRLASVKTGPRGFVQLVQNFFDSILEGHEIATRYARLSRTSNADLARLGLTRQHIPRVAVNGVPGL